MFGAFGSKATTLSLLALPSQRLDKLPELRDNIPHILRLVRTEFLFPLTPHAGKAEARRVGRGSVLQVLNRRR